MNRTILYALGVGHNTPVLIDLAESAGYSIAGLYHYDTSRTHEFDHGLEILGSFDELFSASTLKDKSFLLTMGDSDIRQALTERILEKGGFVPTIIHPSAIVSRFAKISSVGVYVGALSVIQADTVIDEGTVILTGVNISHTNNIGKYCFIAGGATIGAYTNVKDFCFIGQGVLTISGKVGEIGERAKIGAGSLVTKSVLPDMFVVGRPARSIETKM